MFCVNDADAILKASKLAHKHQAEVWHRGRFVSRVPSSNNSSRAETAFAVDKSRSPQDPMGCKDPGTASFRTCARQATQ
jgi:hypothetical protein